MVRNARRRLTCENASKYVHFFVPGVALLTPWTPKSLKSVENSLQSEHEKYEARCCNCQKHALSTDLRKCIKTRPLLLFQVLLCSRYGCKNRSKSSKIRFCMDPINFRFKIHEISAIRAKCYLNVARSAPDMKIMEFCKVLPGRAQNMISHAFLNSPFREFSVIFVDFTILLYFSTSFWTLQGSKLHPDTFIFSDFAWIPAFFGSKCAWSKVSAVVPAARRANSKCMTLKKGNVVDLTNGLVGSTDRSVGSTKWRGPCHIPVSGPHYPLSVTPH